MFKIEKAKMEDMEEISELAKKTYLKYNSKIDTEEGVRNVLNFIAVENMRLRFNMSGGLILKARYEDNIAGMIEFVNMEHISLFFVRGEYFKCGIGSALFEEAKNILGCEKYSVNASEYALEFYKKLGFVAVLDSIKVENGVHFHPMLY